MRVPQAVGMPGLAVLCLTPRLLPSYPRSEAGGHLRRKWMDPAYLPAANAWEDANTLAMEQDAAARCVRCRA
jgi:hypothetical protein